MNGKKQVWPVIRNHFCCSPVEPVAHIFINFKRLFTIVEITVVFPVPTFQYKNSIIWFSVKKMAIF
jgi:hypothetical protein